MLRETIHTARRGRVLGTKGGQHSSGPSLPPAPKLRAGRPKNISYISTTSCMDTKPPIFRNGYNNRTKFHLTIYKFQNYKIREAPALYSVNAITISEYIYILNILIFKNNIIIE